MGDDYLIRFWPQFEAFLSFQIISARGLAPGALSEGEYCRQYILSPDASEDRSKLETRKKLLIEKWRMTSAEHARDVLAQPSIQVTSGRDKIMQIAKLIELQKDLSIVVEKWQ